MIKINGNFTTKGKTDRIGFVASQLIPMFRPFTGRSDRTPEQIEAMVLSLLENGQIHDFTYQLDSERNPVPVSGHTRILAADEITNKGLTDHNGITYSLENPFVVTGKFKAGNASEAEGQIEAIVTMFAENDDPTRTPITEMDQVRFVDVLSNEYKLTDAEISKRLSKDLVWVSQHKIAQTLDAMTQGKLDSGEVKISTATVLATIPAENREAVIAAAKAADPTGKVTAAGVAAAIRNLGVETQKPLKRSPKEESAWLNKVVDTLPECPAKAFLFAFIDFRKGIVSETDLNAALKVLSQDSLQRVCSA